MRLTVVSIASICSTLHLLRNQHVETQRLLPLLLLPIPAVVATMSAAGTAKIAATAPALDAAADTRAISCFFHILLLNHHS